MRLSALLFLGLLFLVAPGNAQFLSASIRALQLRPADSLASAVANSTTISPYAVTGASLITRGTKSFVCFGDGFCGPGASRTNCSSCLTWDFSVGGWTDSFSLGIAKHKEVSITSINATTTYAWSGVNSTGGVSSMEYTLSGTQNLTAQQVSFGFSPPRWNSIVWAEGNDLWLYGGCENIRKYPPIRDPLDSVTGPAPVCRSDLWRKSAGGNWTQIRPTSTIPVFGEKGQFAPSNNPAPRIYASYTFDNTGGLWLFGGMRRNRNTFHSDVWLLRNSSWAWMGGAMPNETFMDNFVWNCREGAYHQFNIPAGRQQAAFWFDPTRNNLFLHGGNLFWEDINSTYVMSDLWSFSAVTLQWAFVAGAFWPRATPSGFNNVDRWEFPNLAGHVAMVNPSNPSKIVLFGGFGLVQNTSGISASTFEISLSSRANVTLIPQCPNYSAYWTTMPSVNQLLSKTLTVGRMDGRTATWTMRFSPSYPNGAAWFETTYLPDSWDGVLNRTRQAMLIGASMNLTSRFDVHMPYTTTIHQQRYMMSVSDDFGTSYNRDSYFWTGARELSQNAYYWAGGGPANGTLISEGTMCLTWCGWTNPSHVGNQAENCTEMSQIVRWNWNDLPCTAMRNSLYMYTCSESCTLPFKLNPQTCQCELYGHFGCLGGSPGPDWYCDELLLRWVTVPGVEVVVNSTTNPLVVSSPVITVTANLTITSGAVVVFNSPKNQIQTSGSSCVEIDGGNLQVDVSQENILLLTNSSTTIISGCVTGQFSNVTITSPQCTSVTAQQQSSSQGLALLFDVSTVSTCGQPPSSSQVEGGGFPTWGIIVAVIGAVVLIAAIILAVTLSPRLRKAVRPFSARDRDGVSSPE